MLCLRPSRKLARIFNLSALNHLDRPFRWRSRAGREGEGREDMKEGREKKRRGEKKREEKKRQEIEMKR